MTQRRVAITLLLVLALAYPAVLLAQGLPSFPSAESCVHPATADGRIVLVLGRFDDMADADAVRDKARAAGFTAAESSVDGCGRVVVAVPGYTDLAGAQSAVAEARTVGLKARPEFAP